jgi:hypothetical protein
MFSTKEPVSEHLREFIDIFMKPTSDRFDVDLLRK